MTAWSPTTPASAATRPANRRSRRSGTPGPTTAACRRTARSSPRCPSCCAPGRRTCCRPRRPPRPAAARPLSDGWRATSSNCRRRSTPCRSRPPYGGAHRVRSSGRPSPSSTSTKPPVAGSGRCRSSTPRRPASRSPCVMPASSTPDTSWSSVTTPGTPFGGAEEWADRLLGGRLTARQVLGRYPSTPNDVLRVVPAGGEGREGFAGVAVVGLGEMGDLTPTALARALHNAARGARARHRSRPCSTRPRRRR